jgi:hypothetical protein
VRADELHLTSAPGGSHGAVRPSATGKHLKISTEDGLTFHRDSVTPNHEIRVVTADDNDLQTTILTGERRKDELLRASILENQDRIRKPGRRKTLPG